MTIAEDLKQSIKALVCHEMDIVHEGDWFKDFVKGIVDESLMENRWLDVLQESEWFSNLVEGIVTSKLNEIQDSEKGSDGWKETEVEGWWTRLSGNKYFLVQWGEGYSTNRPAVYEVKEIIEGEDWQLPCDFIDSLIEAMPCEKLKFTDLSGDVYFHCLGDGKDNRGGLAAGIGYGRS